MANAARTDCMNERGIYTMNENIQKLVALLQDSRRIVFFGGAGVSTESGVRDYRSEDGLYNTVKEYGVSPETILSKSFLERNPAVFYDFYRKYFIDDVQPNRAHKALAELERMGKLTAVVTQNIDGLHQRAGSSRVIELHGTAHTYRCHRCSRAAEDVLPEIVGGAVPSCRYCGGLVRPNVVLYEEMLPEEAIEAAITHIAQADLLIVGGSSMAVYPASSFVQYFRGEHVVMINKSATAFDERAQLLIRDSIGAVLGDAVAALEA